MDGLKIGAVAMGVGEAPDAGPVLNGAQAAGEDAADTAVAPGAGVVVFGDGEGFVEQAGEGVVIAADGTAGDNALIRAA